MNKNAIKKFAIEARQKLIASVTDKAGMLGITTEGVSAPTTKGNDFEVYQTAAGTEVTLNKKQCEQRRRLVEQIETKGFEEVVEEVAYTWFNRICAIRFMEVNDYLPSRVRALSSEKEGKNEPDLVTQAPDVDLDLTDAEKEFVIESKMSGKLDELFAMLFVKQCNKLHEVLPELFEETSDYTELLLNISFTDKESIIQMLVNLETGIPEDDFNVQKSGQVEIIGWLYQYYNEERKNEVINIYKGTVKKEDIPAATQLFTTDWVVRYLVDNSLGRYWIERNQDSKLREKLEFFVMPKNGSIEYIDEKIDPTEITFFDPCMGSGHILVYAFDVFMEIYRECGYSDRDAALNIVQNNLFGLDIDNRAYQLAYFAVMMKARSYNRRALTQGIINNLCAIQESNDIEKFSCDGLTKDSNMNKIGEYLVRTFKDAKEIGSLQSVDENDYTKFAEYLMSIDVEGQFDFNQSDWIQTVKPLCIHLTRQAFIMSRKYCVVATNPPYLGKLQGQLKKYLTTKYKDYSGDLFSAFMRRNFDYNMPNGYVAFMTPYVWMFIRQYLKLRDYILSSKGIVTLIQFEYSAFEEATVPICSFVIKNGKHDIGTYIKLSDYKGGMNVQKEKFLETVNHKTFDLYDKDITTFENIPGHPIAFWSSNKIEQIFKTTKPLEDFATIRVGMHTGNNDIFLREWYEVDYNNICFTCRSHQDTFKIQEKWYPYNKGGGTRKWYGYRTKVVNWQFGGRDIHKFHDLPMDYNGAPVRAKGLQFKESITWSDIGSTGRFGCRYTEPGAMFDVKGSSAFPHENKKMFYIMAFLNSKIASYLLQMLNPTISYQVGNISALPLEYVESDVIDSLVMQCIENERNDWNSYEISWDFKSNDIVQLAKENHLIKDCVEILSKRRRDIFEKEYENEKKLNEELRLIYGIEQSELNTEPDKTEISIRLSDKKNDIVELLSYAIGCIFGRYSLVKDGVIYAGGVWDSSQYGEYTPDFDNVIPITDEEYFEDDIVGKICEWVKFVFGENGLEENLEYIAMALNTKGDSPRASIRSYFMNDFIADHIKMYQKKPIYWLFDSGKENGFKVLVYMHRYTPDTVGIIRTDYLHKTQKAIEQAMQRAEYTSENASSASDKKKAVQQITKYTKQLAQMKSYDEAMAHIANQRIEIDLDDGVKVNYEKFQGVEVAQEGKKALKIDLLTKIK